MNERFFIDELRNRIPRHDDLMYFSINEEFGFTLQNEVIHSAVHDASDGNVEEKIKLISKYLTKVLAYRVWNHCSITENAMKLGVKKLCLKLAETKSLEDVADVLKNFQYRNWILGIDDTCPVLNNRNRKRILVLLKLLTAIVAKDSDEQLHQPHYLHIAHLWSYVDELSKGSDFVIYKNRIGNLVLNDFSYRLDWSRLLFERKCEYLKNQNCLARSVYEYRIANPFKFIDMRTGLYREILKKHFGE